MAGGRNDAVSQTFGAFMEEHVLPRRRKYPDHVRLDGKKSGANRKIFGRFLRQGREWSVLADTHYEPLMLAYLSWLESAEPFEERVLSRGRRLDLNRDVAARLSDPKSAKLNVHGK